MKIYEFINSICNHIKSTTGESESGDKFLIRAKAKKLRAKQVPHFIKLAIPNMFIENLGMIN